MNSFYPHNLTGLGEAYVAGLPFFRNSLAGDLFFSSVLFGVFYILNSRKALKTA
jgi:hypothetical protein